MKKKKSLFLSIFLLLVILLVIDFLSPFNLSRFFGGQLAATYNAVTTPIQPYTYWQFEGTPWNTPTIGSSSFTDGTSCSFVQTANGPVGKYLNYTSNSGCYQNIGKTPSSPSTSFAVEFIWKPSDILVSNFITTTDNSFSVLFESPVASTSVPYIKFSTTGTTGTNSVSDDFQIALDGVGPKSPAYYNDGNWHHMVFKYSNGVKEVWVDGLLPSGFSKTVPNTNKIKSSNGDIKFFGNSTAERRYIGAIDQFALWSNDLPGNLIYQQYLDSIVNGQSYSWVTNITNTPNPQAVSASFDPLDYLPGAQLGISPYTTYSTTPPTVLNQLQSVPLPRYKTGHTLLRNFNWNDLDYLAHFTPTDFTYTHSAAQVQAGVAIAGEMASKWNYYLDLAPSLTSSNLDTGVSGVPGLISYSNSNPTLPTQLVILRAQLSGSSTCGGGSNTPCLKYQGFGNQYYLQNASGQFIDINGNVTTSKVWRPLSSQFSQYTPDGNAMKSMVNSVVSQLTKPVPKIDLISENGEILVKYETSALNSDPAVSSAISSSGMDAQTYVAKMVSDMANQTYRDVILSIQGLAGSKYLEYAVDGYEEATRFKWSEARKMQSPINGQYYATPDFYPRWPSNWRSKISAWNGMYFIQKVMGRQQATGDKFFGAYMSPGWDLKAELNISPGQWLGLSKNINNMGSEFFHTGYFNRVGTNEDGWPAQKIWQNMIPSYSQAVFSYVDSFYKNSNIMTGDLPLDYASSSTTPGYAFKSGRMDAFTTIRKDNSANKYLIVSNLNQYTNMDGAVPEIAPVSISLSGESLKFNSRRQGSTYIYDKTGATPVFYQLDAWHESSHPWYWSKDFNFESEVYDTGTASRTTTVPAGTQAGDYTNFTTYINPSSGSTTYKFEPRDATGTTPKTYYLWYFAKSATGTSTASVKVDSGTAQTISSNSTTFGWCNKNQGGTPMVFSGITPNTSHTFTFTGLSANFQFDKFILTENANLNLGSCGPETVLPVVSITAPLDGTSITAGSIVTISANATDASGIASVEFKVDGTSIGIDTVSPYSVSWDTAGVSGGNHVITAVAIDSVGNTATSTPVNTTVLSGTYISWVFPTNGLTVQSGQVYNMQVSVGGPITKVKYFRYNNGLTKECTSSSLPNFSCTWRPIGLITKDIQYQAKGYDSQGLEVASTPIITVTRVSVF